jgi:RNA polymerase sigma factor (TIGR02999 family)
MPTVRQQEVTRVLAELASGAPSAVEKLTPLVYDELRALAQSFFSHQRPNHTLQPTALVHEAYMRLVGRSPTPWSGRAHFFATAAKVMRQLLADHARRHGAAKRGGGWGKITLDEAVSPTSTPDIDLIALDEALNRLTKLHERQGQIVELRFLAGLTVEETAQVLGSSPRTVELDWRMARAWLRRELGDD